jgi:hypothetical protein
MTPHRHCLVGLILAVFLPSWALAQTGTAPKAEDSAGTPFTLDQIALNPEGRWYRLGFRLELGSLGVLDHKIQFGEDGTEFDYVKDGGQGNLYFTQRYEAEMNLWKNHTFLLVYQPINVVTEVKLTEDLRVYETTFAEGTPMRLRYGFDFTRMSYLYDFFDEPETEVGIGASFQLRNAVIDFVSINGQQLAANKNIGPVPVLKFRAQKWEKNGLYYGAEADGFWASGRFITGTTNDFEGAILDTSVKAGFRWTPFATSLVTLRYIGGGARGVEEDADEPGDGYTNNWLHTVSLTVGFLLH